MGCPSSCCCDRLDLHLVAELVELRDETPGLGLGWTTVEVIGAQVDMLRAVLQHVIDAVRIDAPTAQIAFCGPRLPDNR
jgi:hypothetical protein